MADILNIGIELQELDLKELFKNHPNTEDVLSGIIEIDAKHPKISNMNFGSGLTLTRQKQDEGYLADALLPFSTLPEGKLFSIGRTSDDKFVFETKYKEPSGQGESLIVSSYDRNSKGLLIGEVIDGKICPIGEENKHLLASHLQMIIPKLAKGGLLGEELKDATEELLNYPSSSSPDLTKFKDKIDNYLEAFSDVFLKHGKDSKGNLVIDIDHIRTPKNPEDKLDEFLEKGLDIDKVNPSNGKPFEYFEVKNKIGNTVGRQVDFTTLAGLADFLDYPRSDEVNKELRNNKNWIVTDWFLDVVFAIDNHLLMDEVKYSVNPDDNFTPLAVNLVGKMGGGKSESAKWLSKLFGLDYNLFQATIEMTGEDLLVTSEIDQSDGKFKTRLNVSPAISPAESKNQVIVIDEADLLPPGVSVAINQVLAEGQTTIKDDLKGSRVFKCAPGVIYFMCSNKGLAEKSVGGIELSTADRAYQEGTTYFVSSLSTEDMIKVAKTSNESQACIQAALQTGTLDSADLDYIDQVFDAIEPAITRYNNNIASSASRRNSKQSYTQEIGVRILQNMFQDSIRSLDIYNGDFTQALLEQFVNPDKQSGLRYAGSPQYKELVEAIEKALSNI